MLNPDDRDVENGGLNRFERYAARQMTPRQLILWLFSARLDKTLSSAELAKAGELVGFDHAATRVALARLVKDGSLRSAARGEYSLGSRAQTVRQTVMSWQALPNRMAAWNGGWILAVAGHLPRSDRSAQRRLERALSWQGFAQTAPGAWMRPDNLIEGAQCLYARACDLGMDRNVIFAAAQQVVNGAPEDACALWRLHDLEAGYETALNAMTETQRAYGDAPSPAAAAQTLRIGGAVIATLLSDPLLPQDLIGPTLRMQVHGAMLDFDEYGKAIWNKLLGVAT